MMEARLSETWLEKQLVVYSCIGAARRLKMKAFTLGEEL